MQTLNAKPPFTKLLNKSMKQVVNWVNPALIDLHKMISLKFQKNGHLMDYF